jgi:regulator of ribonuclease activity A
VVDGGGSLPCALVGDLIAAIAVERGWSGPLGTNPRTSSKTGTGQVGEVVEIGGIRISPGQTVVSGKDASSSILTHSGAARPSRVCIP